MTYLQTTKMPPRWVGTEDPRWIDVLVEANRQRANTFSTPWATGQTDEGRIFEEYPAHWIVFDHGEEPWAQAYIIAKTEGGARVLRYAVFELACASGAALAVIEGPAPVSTTPKLKVDVPG